MSRIKLTRYLDLAFHTAIYSLNWSAGIVAGLLMLPIYSQELSVEDYGALDLATQMSGFIRSIFASAFTYSIAKFFHDADTDAGRSEAIWANATGLSLLGILGCAVATLFNKALAIYVFGSTTYENFVLLTSLTIAVEFCTLGFTSHFLVEKKSLLFVGLSIVRLLLAIIFNLFFLVHLKLGGIGMLLGGLAASAIMLIVYAVICCRRYRFYLNFSLARKMLIVGSPMIPATFLAMFLHQGDRLFLSHFAGLESLGIYTMAALFPSQLNALLLTSFNQVWINSFLHERKNNSSSTGDLSSVCVLFMGLYMVCQAILCYLSPVLYFFLVDKKFDLSIPQIPLIASAYCVHALYIFLATKGFVTGRFLPLTLSYLVACFAKLFLYLTAFFVLGLSPGIIMGLSYFVFVFCCFLFYRDKDFRVVDIPTTGLQFVCFFYVVIIFHPHANIEFSFWSILGAVSWICGISVFITLPVVLHYFRARLRLVGA